MLDTNVLTIEKLHFSKHSKLELERSHSKNYLLMAIIYSDPKKLCVASKGKTNQFVSKLCKPTCCISRYANGGGNVMERKVELHYGVKN
jgi:hypothetical protein